LYKSKLEMLPPQYFDPFFDKKLCHTEKKEKRSNKLNIKDLSLFSHTTLCEI
jgi:hypothetical protein